MAVTRDVTKEEQSRQQLAASAEYLRRTLDATGDAIFAIDAEDQKAPVRFVNEQLLQMWGIPAERAVGLTPQGITEFTSLQMFDPVVEIARVAEIVAANRPHESKMYLRDGRTLLRRCVPAQVGHRSVRIWSFRDISAEQARIALEGELRTMLDVFPGLIARAGEDFRYDYVNQRFADMFAKTPEQLVGRHLRDVLGAERFAQVQERRQRIVASGHADSIERRVDLPDGRFVDLLLTTFEVKPQHPGGRAKYYQVGIDITARKRAEQQLQVATEQLQRRSRDLQNTLDSITQGILSMDADGRVRVYNRRALELLELPDSLVGPDTHYDDIRAFQVARGDLATSAGKLDFSGTHRGFDEVRASSPDVYMRRTHSDALLEVRTRQMPGGATVRTYADVTAYVEAQQALQALLEAFPGSISAVDMDGTYSYVNERLAAVLGRPAEAIIGRKASEMVGPARWVVIEQAMRRAVAGESAISERVYEVDGGRRQIHLEITHVAGPVHPGGRQTVYAFGIDITARKQAEAALIGARDEAERANRAKSQFLSHMSHELRTPMNAILGFTQLLQSDSQHPLTGPQSAQVSEILRGARHLLELINEVLDLGQVESGELSVERVAVPLGELIDDCLALMRPLALVHQVSLLPPDRALADERVWADRTRLKQVLLNLLANAIKYNRPGGTVEVLCQHEADALRVAVRDSGRGLSADEQGQLFQPFERLSAARSDIEGTGIGLALSQRLAQAMGGSMGAASELGQGSTFWIQLPRAIAFAGPASGTSEATKDTSSRLQTRPDCTVLYIEDNPINVILMQAMLGRLEGIRTLVAEEPLLGLALAQSEHPDLVLLDIQLPGIDGFEVLRRLRDDERTRQIPVVAVSANAMQADIDAGLAAGFAAYLTKPIELETLLATVQRLLHAGHSGP